MTDSELKPCRKCGELDFDMWDGKGTQAELSCNSCGESESIQVSDLFSYEERYGGQFDFSYDTLSYPLVAIDRAKNELIKGWNTRAKDPTHQLLVDALERVSGMFPKNLNRVAHPKDIEIPLIARAALKAAKGELNKNENNAK